MVGPRGIVAERFRRVLPEENRAGVADTARERTRLPYEQLEVLRCDLVGDCCGAIEGVDYGDGAVALE